MTNPRIALRTMVLGIGFLAVLLGLARAFLSGPRYLRGSDGPFLVWVHTFRGADVEREAFHLAAFLRRKTYAAYVGPVTYRTKRAGKPSGEFVVVVGDATSIDESERLLHRLKRELAVLPTELVGKPIKVRPRLSMNPSMTFEEALQRGKAAPPVTPR